MITTLIMSLYLPRLLSFSEPRIGYGFSSSYASFSTSQKVNNDLVSVAPMMEYTDTNFRFLLRLISKRTKLYTEMVPANTLAYNKEVGRWLKFNPEEEPLVLQLGGSEVKFMGQATHKAMKYGYREINLNCGCPSERVAESGAFGAALMLKPRIVADLCQCIQHSSEAFQSSNNSEQQLIIPSVKCRIGVIDKTDMKTKLDGNEEDYQTLAEFVHQVSDQGGVNHFIVHARKAVLGGLSTTKNRQIPPLKYEFVHRLNTDFPHLHFTINGGFETIESGQNHLHRGLRGLMLGRGVVSAPWKVLSRVDQDIFNDPPSTNTRRKVLVDYAKYAENQMRQIQLHNRERAPNLRRALLRPIAYLFSGEKHGAKYRKLIENQLRYPSLSVSEIIQTASSVIADEVVDAVSMPLNA